MQYVDISSFYSISADLKYIPLAKSEKYDKSKFFRDFSMIEMDWKTILDISIPANYALILFCHFGNHSRIYNTNNTYA